MKPFMVCRPPGPKAAAILERDHKVTSPSAAREHPLVMQRAEGMNLWDIDGNRYLDYSAGISVMNTGWNHPEVVKAVREQAALITHGAFLDFCEEIPVTYAEEIVSLLPPPLDRVYYSNSGAESLEAALKLARHHTKRNYFLAFYGGFHGRTYGALSLTCSKVIQREHFGPFLPVIHAPYPDPYRPLGLTGRTCDVDVLQYIEEEVFRTEVSPREVAAIVVEPIQGESGYIVPPTSFLAGLRELCDEHGILLVDDEVQAGCFRTGKFLACEHSNVIPDIVCLAKAIGGGLPLGVTVASDEVMTWPPGSHASTFGGNVLSCTAGLTSLRIMKEHGFAERVAANGRKFLARLEELKSRHPLIGDVRGRGLMIGMELVKDQASKEPAEKVRDDIVRSAFETGLVLLPAGQSVIRFSPPLIIGEEDIDSGLAVLEQAIEGVEGTVPRCEPPGEQSRECRR